MGDQFEKFVNAQDGVFDGAIAELRAGGKRSHWMWFVFPQIAGLGHSAMSQEFALASVEEAREYLAHPVLGPRLKEATRAAMRHVDARGVPALTARALFGRPDDLKFHSSMSLFHLAEPQEKLFKDALAAYFQGEIDPQTAARAT